MQQETLKNLPIRVEPVPEDMIWTDESPKAQAGQAEMPDVEVLLAIDLSGSMSGNPIMKAQEAMINFVDQMDSRFIKVGIAAFADNTKCILSPTDNFKAVKKAISTLNSVDVGWGNDAEPFTISRSILKRGEVRYVVVLTDGRWSNQTEAIAAASRCHKNGVEIMALGFGTADQKFLTDVASIKEFASLTSLAELSSSFSKIAQAIGEDAGNLKIR